MKTLSEVRAWSILSPYPTVVHFAEIDQYAVAWRGVVMGYMQGMLLLTEYHAGIYPTPKMKTSVFVEFVQLCRSGAFSDPKYMKYATGIQHYDQLRFYLKKLVDKKAITPADIPVWLNKENAVTVGVGIE